MQYKDLTFSSYLIIVDDKLLDETQFYKAFENGVMLPWTNNDTDYVLNITKVDDYVKVYIEYGNPFPRPDNVINTDTHQAEDNPRNNNQYEPKQEFALIDFTKSILWLSNSKRKTFFTDILKEKLETTNIIIKNVYSEEDFINSIKKVEEIKFSAVPNLFSSTQTLTQKLSEEILGYGSNIATLILKYSNGSSVTENILSKIKNLLSHKETYKSLVITGRDADNFGIIFNNEILSKRIPLKAIINDNEIFNVENVYSQLIAKLKEQ